MTPTQLKLSPADYWKFAHRARVLPEEIKNSADTEPGVLARIDGYEIVLDNESSSTWAQDWATADEILKKHGV